MQPIANVETQMAPFAGMPKKTSREFAMSNGPVSWTAPSRNVGIYLADSLVVPVIHPSPERNTALLERIADLTQRWLPMLLRRAEVENDLLAALREPITSPADLRARLERAHAATLRSSKQTDERAALWARSSAEVIGALLRGFDLADRNPRLADRIVRRTNERVFSLLVGRADAPERPSRWWQRIFSRAAGFEATAS
jgi:hypothetical protein